MQVLLLYSPAARQVRQWMLTLPHHTTLAQALARADLFADCAELQNVSHDSFLLAVWGRRAGLDYLLQDGDRLEILRPLRVDPMVARRERFQGQGVKSAGLFAERRVGAKAGY